MDTNAKSLIFHSSITLLIGLLAGVPYGRAINRDAAIEKVNAWKLVHASLPLGAVLGFAVGCVLPALTAETAVKTLLAWSFIVSNYAFCISLPLGALVGKRGLRRSGPASNRVVWIGNITGAAMALIGAIVLVYASFLSLAST